MCPMRVMFLATASICVLTCHPATTTAATTTTTTATTTTTVTTTVTTNTNTDTDTDTDTSTATEPNNPELPVPKPGCHWTPEVTPLRSAYFVFSSEDDDGNATPGQV